MMNMLTQNKIENDHHQLSFIAQAVFAVEATQSQVNGEKQLRTKQLLDRLFPLEKGSHQDVVSYEIDYQHVQAYFKDGQHSGLQHAKHFVAYTGDKCHPCSIVLRDASGTHVEVMIGCRPGTGHLEQVNIEDVLLECCTTFGERDGDHASGIRHWVSLVKGDQCGRATASNEDKEYTAKNGDDYKLGFCFDL
ncbi:Malate synthase G [Vibrio hippocampi]|uniref:Malate synthase G n=2 Tax=Vibrio hippocampi TaxID=654686 RepID=A0ABN8DLA0_9VIBR|nr:Malate synthase G [Vibrio hippocampi]